MKRVAAIALVVCAATASADDKFPAPKHLTTPTTKPCLVVDERNAGEAKAMNTFQVWTDAQGRPTFMTDNDTAKIAWSYDANGWLVRMDADFTDQALAYQTFAYGEHGELVEHVSREDHGKDSFTSRLAFAWKGTFDGKAAPPSYGRAIAQYVAARSWPLFAIEGSAVYQPPAFTGTVTESGTHLFPGSKQGPWTFDRKAGTVVFDSEETGRHTITRKTTDGKLAITDDTATTHHAQTWKGDQVLDEDIRTEDDHYHWTYSYDAAGHLKSRSPEHQYATTFTATWSCK